MLTPRRAQQNGLAICFLVARATWGPDPCVYCIEGKQLVNVGSYRGGGAADSFFDLLFRLRRAQQNGLAIFFPRRATHMFSLRTSEALLAAAWGTRARLDWIFLRCRSMATPEDRPTASGTTPSARRYRRGRRLKGRAVSTSAVDKCSHPARLHLLRRWRRRALLHEFRRSTARDIGQRCSNAAEDRHRTRLPQM